MDDGWHDVRHDDDMHTVAIFNYHSIQQAQGLALALCADLVEQRHDHCRGVVGKRRRVRRHAGICRLGAVTRPQVTGRCTMVRVVLAAVVPGVIARDVRRKDVAAVQ